MNGKEDVGLSVSSVICCDYLVVGAGTAGMSFIDTILTEHSSANKKKKDYRPGGPKL